MADSDRQRWERRYAEKAPGDLRKPPSDLLRRWAPPPGPGSRALELACGLGHNALWLAEQGYRVDALDISFEALRRAQREMLRRGVSGVNFVVADLDHFVLPRRPYDLVIVFRFLDRRLFPAIRDLVRPGGRVIYQTFNTRRADFRAPARADYLLELGELPGHFPGWTVLHASDEGSESQFVAQKPEG